MPNESRTHLVAEPIEAEFVKYMKCFNWVLASRAPERADCGAAVLRSIPLRAACGDASPAIRLRFHRPAASPALRRAEDEFWRPQLFSERFRLLVAALHWYASAGAILAISALPVLLLDGPHWAKRLVALCIVLPLAAVAVALNGTWLLLRTWMNRIERDPSRATARLLRVQDRALAART